MGKSRKREQHPLQASPGRGTVQVPAGRPKTGGAGQRLAGPSPTTGTGAWTVLRPVGVVALACLACFLPVLEAEWTNWDDPANFLQNPHFQGFTKQNLAWMWGSFHLGHYHPLTWMSAALDYSLWGLDPCGYHLTNLLLHAAGAVLLYFTILALLGSVLPAGSTGLRTAALAGALFFAVHPLRVESVAWITERRDVLCGVFLLAAVLAWLRSRAAGIPWHTRAWSYWGSMVLYGLSLLAKASGVVLPVVLLVLDAYPLRRLRDAKGKLQLLPLLLEKIPFFLLAVAGGTLAVLAQAESGALRGWAAHGLAARLAVAGYGFVFYLWKTALPFGLSPLYELETVVDPFQPVYLLAALGVLLAAMTLWIYRKPAPWLAAAVVAYAVLLGPVSGISQAGPQRVADRYSYFACLPLAVLAAAAAWRLAQKRRQGRFPLSAAAPVAVILCLLGALTFHQARLWRDPVTLWRHAVALDPGSAMANFNLGEALGTRLKFGEAIRYYRTSLRLKPGEGRPTVSLGLALVHQNQYPLAIEEWRKVPPRDRPWYPEAQYYIGKACLRLNRPEEAADAYSRALSANPAKLVACRELIPVLQRLGRLAEAARWSAWLASQPDDRE